MTHKPGAVVSETELRRRLAETYERLKKANSDLVQTKARLQADIDCRRTEIATLSNQLQGIPKTTQETPLAKEKAANAARLCELEALREGDARQLTQLQEACEKAVFALCTERKAKAKLIARKKAATADLEKCTSIVKQLKDQPDQVQISQEMADRLRQKQKRIAAKQRSLGSQISALKEEIAKLENDGVALAQGIEQKNALIGELEGRIERRNETQDDLERRCEMAVTESEQMSREINQLSSQKEALAKEISELTSAIAKVQAECADVAKKYEARHTALLALTTNVESLVPKYEQQLQESAESLEQKRLLCISPFDAKFSEKEKSVQQFRQAMDQCVRSSEGMDEKIGELERDAQADRTQFQKLKEQYNIQFQAQARIMSTLSMNGDQLAQ
jgi:chromosome segregation ATPase